MKESIKSENMDIKSTESSVEHNVFSGKKKLQEIAAEVLDTELVKKEHKMDVDDLKGEIHENYVLWKEFENDVLDVFSDLDDGDLDDCLDEIKKIRLFLGSKVNGSMLKVILFRIKENQQIEKKEKTTTKSSKNLAEELHDAFLNETIEYFDEPFDNFISEKHDFFGYLLYLQSCQDELDDKQKKVLAQWFEEMMAWIMEGKALEIYEIQIVGGKIVIKGQMNGQAVNLIYDVKSENFKNINGVDIDLSDNVKDKMLDDVEEFSDEVINNM